MMQIPLQMMQIPHKPVFPLDGRTSAIKSAYSIEQNMQIIVWVGRFFPETLP